MGASRVRATWLLMVAILLWLAACVLPVASCAQQSSDGGATGAYALIVGWEVTSAWPAWIGQFVVFGLGIVAIRRAKTQPREARRTSAAALLVAALAITNAAIFLTSGPVTCDRDGQGMHLSAGFFLWSIAMVCAASAGIFRLGSQHEE